MMQLSPKTTLQDGKYEIIRVLGQGGFGITYLAYNTLLEKYVALKEFFPKDFCGRDDTSHLTIGTQSNAETVANLKKRFLKEAKNIAKLDNPGIVRIHDIFQENNTAYYVMDYVEGESLNSIIKHLGPLPEDRAIELINSVGNALEYIHSCNMTHFDVKPANIMVRSSDYQPILIDFGLSKQYDGNGDATSTLMQGVSQGYSPIELYHAGALTSFSPQTDIYSLGATLYKLVTGTTPPPASQIVEEGLTFPPEITDEVRNAIEHAMQPSRQKRPESVSEFLAEVPTESKQVNTPEVTGDEDTIIITHPCHPETEKPKSETRKTSPWTYIFLAIGVAPVLIVIWDLWNSGKTASEVYIPVVDEESVVVDEPYYLIEDSCAVDSVEWYESPAD